MPLSAPPSTPDENGRAGRYVRQVAGYRAFLPAPLPPDPPIRIDPTMQRRLSAADQALGRLDGSIQTLPNPDLFVMMYVRKEAVLSSQIEGTQASLGDLLKVEAEIVGSDTPRDVDEIVNYVGAMNHGLARLPDLPLSVRLIRELHGRLLQGVRGHRLQPGELRTSQNWIGPPGGTLANAAFVPPPHHEVPAALGALEAFLHAEDDMPPLIRIGLAHAQFETIHPFLDGNGRVGRLLITFLLCERKLLQKPVLYLSTYLKAHRDDYYRRLQAVRDHGAWEEWLTFFLDGVTQTAAEATETARRIVALREAHRALIADHFGRSAADGMRLLEHLYRRPTISVNDARSTLAISYPSASKIVGLFVEHGLLREITGQARNRRFQYSPYIALFQEI